jgi:hypothetical protein
VYQVLGGVGDGIGLVQYLLYVCVCVCDVGAVADPGPVSNAFLTLRSGLGKKSGSGSGMNIPDHISESLEKIFGVKNT